MEAIRQAVEQNPLTKFIPLSVAVCCSFSRSLRPILPFLTPDRCTFTYFVTFLAELAGPSCAILEKATGYVVLLEAATCRRLFAKCLPACPGGTIPIVAWHEVPGKASPAMSKRQRVEWLKRTVP